MVKQYSLLNQTSLPFKYLEDYKQSGETDYNLAFDRARAEYVNIFLKPGVTYNFTEYELKLAPGCYVIGDKTSILEFSYSSGSTLKAIWESGMGAVRGCRVHIKADSYAGAALYTFSEYLLYCRIESLQAGYPHLYLANNSYKRTFSDNLYICLYDSTKSAESSWTLNANSTADAILNHATTIGGGIWGHKYTDITVEGKFKNVIRNVVDDPYANGYTTTMFGTTVSKSQPYITSGMYHRIIAEAPKNGIWNEITISGGATDTSKGEIAANVYDTCHFQARNDSTTGTWQSEIYYYGDSTHGDIIINSKPWDWSVSAINHETGVAYKPYSLGEESKANVLNSQGLLDLTLHDIQDLDRYVDFRGEFNSGSYSQSGTAVTVTKTSHGLTNGTTHPMYTVSGSFAPGSFVVTVVDANTFTFTHTVSLTGTGTLKWPVADKSAIRNTVRIGAVPGNQVYGVSAYQTITVGTDLIGSGAGGYFTYADMSKLKAGTQYYIPASNTTSKQIGLYKHSASSPAFYLEVVGIYEGRKFLRAYPVTSGTTASNAGKDYGVAFATIGTNLTGMASASTLIGGNFWTHADGSPYCMAFADSLYYSLGYTGLMVVDADVASGVSRMFTDLTGYPKGIMLTHKVETGWLDSEGIAVVNTTKAETGYRKSSKTTTSTSATTVYSVPVATFKSFSGVIQVSDGTNHFTYSVSAVNNGSTGIDQSVATLRSIGTAPATLAISISGGNMIITATPAAATSTKFVVDIKPEYA